jgi:phosphoribosylformimino-5-aminoimidazole carboxamide ribotide isomerase
MRHEPRGLMDLYPAIDIRDGGAVRLTQGDFDRQSDYGDPLELAKRYVAGGARWVHVVDLDAARTGRPVNRPTILAIAAMLDVPVQSGGGVRTEADVRELLGGGVRRVVLGTVALDDPDLARRLSAEFPGRVALGIDYRLGADGRTEVAVRGWKEGSGRSVTDVLVDLAGDPTNAKGQGSAGPAAVIVTAIDRDGMLNGPDLEGLREVLAATDRPVIASGGVATVADIEELARLEVASVDGSDRVARRLAGAISGKALVEGRMTVEEGVAACARFG